MDLITVIVVVAVLVLLRRFFKGGVCKSKARLDGKTVLITGCNTGIGKETVVDMLERGARVLMACRSEERMRRAADECIERTKGAGGGIALFKLDLGSLESVRRCAREILEQEERIDVLINNAGVMMCPLTRTEDGLEMQIGTNHFGHFLLTNLLLDRLKSSPGPSRVVTVSSLAHRDGHMRLDDLNYKDREGEYKRYKAYAQSKLANILFTRELARRLKGTDVTCYTLHPGVIQTELSRHVEDMFGPFRAVVNLLLYPSLFFMKQPKDGAQTSIYCAVDPTLEGESGKYYSDCGEKEPMPQAKDDQVARQLWEISEKVVGLK